MALISPILDDRSYEQLREELVRRIAVYTPEWTDHNESDPGIALLELFAYLGESMLYRFNQIPETTKIEFLRLLGVRPRPARPARAIVVADTQVPGGGQLPSGSVLAAGKVLFQAEGSSYAWPLDCVAAGKVEAPAADGSRAERDRRADAIARASLASGAPATFYVTSTLPDDPAADGAVPLDVSATLDHSLWLAVLRRPATDLTALGGRSLFVALAFDEQLETPFALQDLTAPQTQRFASTSLTPEPPPMLWQLWNGPDAGFAQLAVGSDTTAGLVSTGVVEVFLPQTLPVFDPAVRSSGDQDNPPPLPDEKQAALVVAWLRVSRPDSASVGDAIHRITWAGLNGVPVVQSCAAKPELAGTGTGDAGQRYPLTQHPVLPGTTVLQVEEPDGWHDWQEVDTFTASGAADRHYVVDLDAGAVNFGGPRVPQIGERIRTLTYRFGGGLAGNVQAGAISAIRDAGPGRAAGLKVRNPLPATGGADVAGLDEALDAIPIQVHRRDRAVTAADFTGLAMEVTGVARAEALPLLHPDTPAVQAAGVVSVLILPAQDLRDPDAPMPDLGLLSRVAIYLDERRLVTSELYVIPPSYQTIAVSAGLAVRPGYQVDGVRRWVEQLLRQYLAPLPPLGPDGSGWPLARTVRRAELEAVAVQVEGVEYCTGLLLAVPDDSGTGTGTGWTEVAEVGLERWQLPRLGALTVVAGPPLPPGATPAPAGPSAVLVPLPPDVC